jgi:hypothetical protein
MAEDGRGSFSRRKSVWTLEGVVEMTRSSLWAVPYVVALVAVIVGVDVLFFRSRVWFWERLMVNIGIVLVFGAFYLRFLKSP